MASADDYAAWIVQNADKRGTPEFDTVVKAYQDARGAAPSAQQGSKNNDLASQAGLFARSGIKAAAALPAMFVDAVGGVANKAQDLALGEGRGYRFQQQLPQLDRLLTQMGLPQPDTPTQRIVSQGVETGLGALTGAGLANQAGKVSTGTTREVFNRLGADPLMQTVAGMGSGMAGQQSAENGAGFGGQMASSVLGGLGAAGTLGAARTGASALSNLITPKTAPVDVERRITVALQNQGIDPASITPALRQSLMDDVRQALKTGGSLNEDALARLADYRRLGLTPTRGRLTLDPFDVTQEQNAMRMAAATGAKDARLPQIAQGNNQGLMGAVESFGPLNDAYGAGQRAMSPIMSRDAMLEAQKRALYQQANQMAGGNVPLERGVIQNVYDELIKTNRLSSVPADIMAKLDAISKGSVTREGKTYETPWNVNVLDEIKSDIADAMRRADGRTKNALSTIRNVLDSDAVMPDKRVFGNQQLVTGAQGQAMAAADQAPANLLNTLNQARAANRAWMQWRESTPGVAAAVNETAPEAWVRDFILNKKAAINDVTRLAGEIGSSQPALEAVRGQIVQHLKSAAIGKGNANETANFSGRQWLSALSDIGDRKLSLFFSPEELASLKAIGRVGSIETFQPRGSAVNNSNTAAGVANLLQGLSKYVQPLANKLPFGSAAITDPLNSLTLYTMERGATNVPRGLLNPTAQPPRNPWDPLLLPGLLSVSP
jgi:hypothetical protein